MRVFFFFLTLFFWGCVSPLAALPLSGVCAANTVCTAVPSPDSLSLKTEKQRSLPAFLLKKLPIEEKQPRFVQKMIEKRAKRLLKRAANPKEESNPNKRGVLSLVFSAFSLQLILLGIASLTSGSFAGSLIALSALSFLFGLIFGLVGFILGLLGLRRDENKVMARIGTILSCLPMALLAVYMVVIAIFILTF